MNTPKYKTLLDIVIPKVALTHEQHLLKQAYTKWKAMIQRCTSKYWLTKYPTYIGCNICESWLTFSNFYSWLELTPDFQYLELDKDILIPGNKVYSPETCCLVTQPVNCLLNANASRRGDYPIGVSYMKTKRKYAAQLRIFGVKTRLGAFNTPEEASDAYLTAKKEHILGVALTQNVRVATALVTYAKSLI
jgi:hypothetical protein